MESRTVVATDENSEVLDRHGRDRRLRDLLRQSQQALRQRGEREQTFLL